MNDKDIIKALEHCIDNADCENCPIDVCCPSFTDCQKAILDLIKRQQTEIERLEEELANPVVSYTHIYAEDVVKVGFDTKRAIVKATRAEAIKEFEDKVNREITEAIISNDKAIQEREKKHILSMVWSRTGLERSYDRERKMRSDEVFLLWKTAIIPKYAL